LEVVDVFLFRHQQIVEILAFFTDYRAKKTQAAEGDAEAQNFMGECLRDGTMMRKDPVQAMVWFGRAAKQREAISQFNLAKGYLKGEGVRKNTVKAKIWLGKAASQGLVAAKYELEKLEASNG